MIALRASVTFDVVFVLLAVAVVLFVLSTGLLRRLTRPWFLPIGLACFAAAVLVQWKL